MDRVKVILILVIAGLVILLCLKQCDSKKKQGTSESNLSAMNDSLHRIKDKLGKEIVYSQIITGNVTDLQKQVNSKDSALSQLAKLVDKKTHVAVVVGTETNVDGIHKPVIVSRDTIRKDSIVYIYETYRVVFENQWEKGSIFASKDSIVHHIAVKNEFELKDSVISNGIFKPKSYSMIIKNKNPNTVTKELKSFLYTPPPAYKGFWAIAGLVVGSIVTLILVK